MKKITRRKFLRMLGIGAAAAVLPKRNFASLTSARDNTAGAPIEDYSKGGILKHSGPLFIGDIGAPFHHNCRCYPRPDSFGISSGRVRARCDELMESTNMTRAQAFDTAVMEEADALSAIS